MRNLRSRRYLLTQAGALTQAWKSSFELWGSLTAGVPKGYELWDACLHHVLCLPATDEASWLQVSRLCTGHGCDPDTAVSVENKGIFGGG